MKKASGLNLMITVFVCGACVMVVEIVGSRLLAPFFGTTTLVWSNLIGIILTFLSLGYWYGGMVADRRASLSGLSALIFGAAICIACIAFFNPYVLSATTRLGLTSGAVVSTIILFGPPTFLLGIVTPYAAKLRMDSLSTSAQTVGNLAAISTFGSIAGTFLAGFCLLPMLGSNNILLSVSLVLLASSLLIYPWNRFSSRLASFFLIALVLVPNLFSRDNFEKSGVLDIDTAYSRVIIARTVDKTLNREILYLLTSAHGYQSAIFVDHPDELYSKYLYAFRLDHYFHPGIKRALLIGGAGFSYARDFLRRFPEAQLDVVEIDKQMTELAKKYFYLGEEPRLHIFHEDGRTFLKNNQVKYDAIVLDAFSSSGAIPFQLTTSEATHEIYRSLADQGIVLMNLISAVEGSGGKIFRAEYATYKQFFPQVYAFPIDNRDRQARQNIVMVAMKSTAKPSWESSDPDISRVLSDRYLAEVKRDVPIFTDDYAPVEHYLLAL